MVKDTKEDTDSHKTSDAPVNIDHSISKSRHGDKEIHRWFSNDLPLLFSFNLFLMDCIYLQTSFAS